MTSLIRLPVPSELNNAQKIRGDVFAESGYSVDHTITPSHVYPFLVDEPDTETGDRK